MANYCENDMTVLGSEASLVEFVERAPSLDWGAFDLELTATAPDRREYSFGSKWTPPLEALDKIAARFPALIFKLYYFEFGQTIAGEVGWMDGQRGPIKDCWEEAERAFYEGIPRETSWSPTDPRN